MAVFRVTGERIGNRERGLGGGRATKPIPVFAFLSWRRADGQAAS